MTKEVDWLPQDRQLVLLKACGLSFPFTDIPFHPSLADVIGYGGSAGGGKTDGLLAIGLIASIAFPGINIGYFRRNFPQLEGPGGAMLRSRYMYDGLGRLSDKRWSMTTGSIVQFCHCSNPNDVFNYQSQQFDIMLFDESTQFTKDMIDYLLTRNRKTISDERFKPFAVMATNPGGVGHSVFKERFVTLPTIEEPHEYKYDSGIVLKHLFIPSKLTDNQILVQRDPGYANRIGTNELNRKMLLDGDWDVFAGQAYSELSREVHLIEPFPIEPHWNRIAAYDHGFNHPFSYGEAAVDDDGDVYLYKHVSKRLLRPDEIVPLIKPNGYKLQYIHAGHDLWSRQRDGGKTVAESFQTLGIFMQRANIDRVQGVQQVRDYLAWKNKVEVNGVKTDGKPRFYIFKNCQDVYNNLAERIFDTNNPEDVLKADADSNGDGGDDACFVAGTKILTKRGGIPIERVNTGDQVATPLGWSKVTGSLKVGKRKVFNYGIFTCTPNHKIITNRGVVRIDTLRYSDKIMVWNQKQSGGTGSTTGDTQILLPEVTGFIFKGLVSRVMEAKLVSYTEKYGKASTEKYPKGITYTTRTVIQPITALKTLCWLLPKSITILIRLILNMTVQEYLTKTDTLRQNGTKVKLEENGIAKCLKSLGKITNIHLLKRFALYVERHTKLHDLITANSVIKIAKQPHLEEDVVYNLSTESGMYYANGVLVSNCDMVRYLLMSRPRIRLQPKPKNPINTGQYLLDQIENDRRKRMSINNFYNMR